MSLHIERSGHGEPLVLLHGWGLHGGVFTLLAARLSERFDVWNVDLPGHGRSAPLPAPSLAAVAECITDAVPAGATWLGWSLGGMVALAAATGAAPARLVLIATSPRFVAAPPWLGTPVAVLHGFAESLEQDYRATLKRFVALQARGSEHAREETRHLREHLFVHGEPDPAALRGGLDILARADLRPMLPAITMPTLLIGGARDTLIPTAALEATLALLPDARLALIDGAGHAPFLSHPEPFETALMEFLDV